MKPIKIISIFLIMILISNIILYASGKISTFYFWIIIIAAGIITYKGIPKLRRI